ncbi:MAG TPA: UDP-N-acetylmuramoyl-tripeptide--D-alanyl-D-alanine ligase [Patescibacteria group bacterium]|jgi:UDP-N-acetylmuramoyl-tripeptide--D-alanyl-D-alanine ligase|nr:UDP-N-acetylmuramoyl-tripeptide--D-alanyl-D-alanine ligase [Patescibacteria group bacterium]
MIQKLFPYKIQLQILQQGEYRISNFLRWIFNNFGKRELENKKKLVFSAKAKAILILSLAIDALTIVVLTLLFGLIGLIFGLILTSQPYIFLTISVLILKLPEQLLRVWIKRKAMRKLATFKNLTVIGITGSYGKTSVKEFLYAILKTEYPTLKTPESYNTVLGIAKVIDLELDESYKFFVCEMAAYKRGEIKELAEMLKPKYGILTGINEQHLEMFGLIGNTVAAKFELIEAIPQNGFAVINGGNDLVKNNYQKYEKNVVVYGLGDFDFSAKHIKMDEEGSTFDLILNNKSYPCKTKLLGRSQIENMVAASAMAFKLGIKPAKIIEAIGNLSAVAHRLELRRTDKMIVIDDAYNSNVTGFKEALNLLGNFEDREKVIVTPGIVDLGAKTLEIHKKLGKLAEKICDEIVLVGKSDRTNGLSAGVNNQKKVHWINSIRDLQTVLKTLNLKNPVVLLENDLPDNY